MHKLYRLLLSIAMFGLISISQAFSQTLTGTVIKNNSAAQRAHFRVNYNGTWACFDLKNILHSGGFTGYSEGDLNPGASYDCLNDITLTGLATINVSLGGSAYYGSTIATSSITVASFVFAAIPAPTISWNSTPVASLTGGQSYSSTPKATGSSSAGALATVSIDLNTDGVWTPWAYAGGGDGHTGQNNGNTFSPLPGHQYQFRAWATDSVGQNTGYIYTQTYTIPGATWVNLPASPLKAGTSYRFPVVTGTSQSNSLTAVLVDISINGGAWSAWADLGASGSSATNNGNTLVPAIGNTYQFRVWVQDSDGAASGFLYTPVYTVTN